MRSGVLLFGVSCPFDRSTESNCEKENKMIFIRMSGCGSDGDDERFLVNFYERKSYLRKIIFSGMRLQ